MTPGPWGGFGWGGPGLGAAGGRGGSRGVMTLLSSLSALACLGQPQGRRLSQLVLSCFSPRSCRENPQLPVPPGHHEQSDGPTRHGPPAGVHRLRGVRTTSPHSDRPRGAGGVGACSALPRLGVPKDKQAALSGDVANPSHLRPVPAASLLNMGKGMLYVLGACVTLGKSLGRRAEQPPAEEISCPRTSVLWAQGALRDAWASWAP